MGRYFNSFTQQTGSLGDDGVAHAEPVGNDVLTPVALLVNLHGCRFCLAINDAVNKHLVL